MDIAYVIFWTKKVFFSSPNSNKTSEELSAEKFAETLFKVLYVFEVLFTYKNYLSVPSLTLQINTEHRNQRKKS